MGATNIIEQFWSIITGRGITDVGLLPCDKLRFVIQHFPHPLDRYDLTREEEGVGISAGAYLAGAKPLLLIQSTGIGNSLNALMSLNKAYGIPLPIVASWRGAQDERVDAQRPFGSHLERILEAAEIFHVAITCQRELDGVGDVIDYAYRLSEPAVALIRPSTWTEQQYMMDVSHLQNPVKPAGRSPVSNNSVKAKLTRYQAIQTIVDAIDDDTALVCNIGDPSRELYAIRDRPLNFYMTGSLGLASSIGLGIAEHTSRKVWVIDGDGSLLANPNALIQIAARRPRNLVVICLDNKVHGSTGGQPTLSRFIDLSELADALGRLTICRCDDGASFKNSIDDATGPSFIHYHIVPGNAGAPTIPLKNTEIKDRFIKSLISVNNLRV
jgi:sulfopyruvate decarboxylase beta subunit